MADKQERPKEQPPEQPQQSTRPKVKSYLHKFYDRSCAVRDPALYEPASANEEDELRRLLSGNRRGKQRGCHLRPVVWKAMLWIGVNCLIFGALGLAIGFFLPHEPEFVEVPGVQGFVRNRSNAEWNRSASILKYVALGVFGVGALVTAAGLILPSLVWRLFDTEDEEGSAGGEDSCCSAASKAAKRRQQRPPLGGTGTPATAAAVTATTATSGTTTTTISATTAVEAPALSSLVDERPVQPARDPEGHVSHGQVK